MFGAVALRLKRRRPLPCEHERRASTSTLFVYRFPARRFCSRRVGRTDRAHRVRRIMLTGTIAPGEILGRGVFSSRHRDRARRARVPFHVFLERAGVARLSVDRLDAASPDAAVRIAEQVAAARRATFYGWAIVIAEKAGADARQVIATPRPNNPYHADIVLPDIAVEDREEQKRHAQQLADSSRWRARDSR